MNFIHLRFSCILETQLRNKFHSCNSINWNVKKKNLNPYSIWQVKKKNEKNIRRTRIRNKGPYINGSNQTEWYANDANLLLFVVRTKKKKKKNSLKSIMFRKMSSHLFHSWRMEFKTRKKNEIILKLVVIGHLLFLLFPFTVFLSLLFFLIFFFKVNGNEEREREI